MMIGASSTGDSGGPSDAGSDQPALDDATYQEARARAHPRSQLANGDVQFGDRARISRPIRHVWLTGDRGGLAVEHRC
jgi:hypothetical protein